MKTYKLLEFVFIFVFLVFALKVYSQRTVLDSVEILPSLSNFERTSGSCDSNSYCVPIRRCRSLRNRHDWRTAGNKCEFGDGEYLSVCCPLPKSMRSSVVVDTINNEKCGQSRLDRTRSPLQTGIVNATEGAWPWMAAITKRESSGKHTVWCTGFLIDRKHILSAAHCFDKTETGLYLAHIGKDNQKEGETYAIVRIAIPEGYNPGFFYSDIAILTLDREVDVPKFNPICLPDNHFINKDLAGMEATEVGWGRENLGGVFTSFLKEGSSRIVPNQMCNQAYREKMTNFQRQFPRGLNSAFICSRTTEGECVIGSGGPLMYQDRDRWFAIGIISFGYGCGNQGVPNGYTNVTHYVDWIKENTRD